MSAAALALGAAALVAGGLSAGLAGLVAWCGPIDPPRRRGSHSRLTPTSGGLAILAGTSLGAGISVGLSPAVLHDGSGALALTLAMASGLGLLGALDDLVDLGAKPKLAAQMLLALAFAFAVSRVVTLPLLPGVDLHLGAWLGGAGAALWIVVCVNAVNFMDGADGLAGSAMAVAFAALAAGAWIAGRPEVAAAALAAAAANLGYLPWNLSGRLFQGDAGALFSGFLLAALALIAEHGGAGLYIYFAPLAVLPLLTDVLLTLLLRARRGRSLLEAHRDHLYQLWLQRTGRSHAALTRRGAAIMAIYALAALAVQQAPSGWRAGLFLSAVGASAMGWIVIRRRLERSVAAGGAQ